MNKTQSNNKSRFIGSYLIGQVAAREHSAGQWIQIADTAQAFRQTDTLALAAAELSKLSALGDYYWVARFYAALSMNSKPEDRARAETFLETVADYGPQSYRARSMLALGTKHYRHGNTKSAKDFYREAERLWPNDLIILQAGQMRAQIASMEGNNREALLLLQKLRPIAQNSPYTHLRYNLFNSLAVELNAAGRLTEAQHYALQCVSSPFAAAYPEWKETARDIYSPSRHLIYTPAPVPDKIACVTSNLARAYMDDFTRYRKKRQANEPAKPTHYELALANKVLEGGMTAQEADFIDTMRELVKKTHPDYETLKAIVEFAEKAVKQEKE